VHRKEYSAGAVKLSFWFAEFSKVLGLLCDGMNMSEIKIAAENENIFSAATSARSKQIYSTVSMRVNSLPDSFYTIFHKATIESKRIFNLISIMATDTLFFDFMYEVYREKLMLGDTVLADMDIRVFFHDKQEQSEKVAKWTDETIARLQKSYKAWLSDAGLIDHSIGDRKIIKPFIDYDLEELLMQNNMKPILDALTGAR
jgi:hypothetical protein